MFNSWEYSLGVSDQCVVHILIWLLKVIRYDSDIR